MSIGYMAIIFIRNKPSDVKGLKDINTESKDYQQNSTNKDVNIKYLFEKNKHEDDLSDESDYEEETDDEDEEQEPTRFERVKQLFSYMFFISICLAYFLAQMIKTLISDWTQIYLIKIHHIKPFSGI